MLKKLALVVALTLPLSFIGLDAAVAAEHEVRMLNEGESGRMVFEPALLRVAPGDTVIFKSVNPGHNAETIRGMLPEGGKAFKGRISKELSVTFETEGVYGYKCLPHYAMGMVGLIVVGDPSANIEAAAAAKLPGKAREKMTALLKTVGQKVAASR